MAAKKDSSFENLPLVGKLFILGLIIAVVGAIYYFAFHMSLAEDIEAQETRATRLQNELREAEQRQQEYLQLTQELASREGIDRQNKRVLPEDAEIPAFLQDLNRVAELSGLQMRLVEPRPEEAEQLYIRIPVQLQFSGKFHQLAKFFYNVSQLERAINLENITLRDPETNEADEVVLTVDALATTFRRPAEEGPASAPPQTAGAAVAPGGAR